jgi:hypothetical protein
LISGLASVLNIGGKCDGIVAGDTVLFLPVHLVDITVDKPWNTTVHDEGRDSPVGCGRKSEDFTQVVLRRLDEPKASFTIVVSTVTAMPSEDLPHATVAAGNATTAAAGKKNTAGRKEVEMIGSVILTGGLWFRAGWLGRCLNIALLDLSIAPAKMTELP